MNSIIVPHVDEVHALLYPE